MYLYDGEIYSISETFLFQLESSDFSYFAPVRLKNRNLDSYGIINSITGEVYPLYMMVPCGHCTLCKNRKVNEWKIRAVCETVYSSSPPLFLTLTFNNENLPEQGLDKRHVQLFLKRLRFRLGESNLRYFAVGEYGRNYFRPHYHLIFWNFPHFYDLRDALKLIEECWQQGFCYLKPATSGSIGYVMKYMRKDCVVPKGMNSTFYLASRGRGKNSGIGSLWIMDNMQHFFDHPDDFKVRVTDPFTGKYFESVLPAYFRRKLFPSTSMMLPAPVMPILAHLDYLRSVCRLFLSHDGVEYYPDYDSSKHEPDVRYVFDTCTKFLSRFPFYEPSNLDNIHIKEMVDRVFGVYTDEKFNSFVRSTLVHLRLMTEELNAMEFDCERWRKVNECKSIMSHFMDLAFNVPSLEDIKNAEYSLNRQWRLQTYNEIF